MKGPCAALLQLAGGGGGLRVLNVRVGEYVAAGTAGEPAHTFTMVPWEDKLGAALGSKRFTQGQWSSFLFPLSPLSPSVSLETGPSEVFCPLSPKFAIHLSVCLCVSASLNTFRRENAATSVYVLII